VFTHPHFNGSGFFHKAKAGFSKKPATFVARLLANDKIVHVNYGKSNIAKQ
jgi:hypothetical protein